MMTQKGFSLQVSAAHLRAIENRAAEGKKRIKEILSAAQFFY